MVVYSMADLLTRWSTSNNYHLFSVLTMALLILINVVKGACISVLVLANDFYFCDSSVRISYKHLFSVFFCS